MTAMAPATSSQRKCRLPCFEILPSLSLPPLECCLGTKPIHAARLRPDVNSFQSPTSATRAPDAFADHHHAIGIHAVNLKNRLRDVETDRANLAHGRLPSSGVFRHNHPMAP